MKRAASFNPVYPFEEQTQPNTALPPFFSSDGLEEKPGGTLGLKITNPLGFDLDGNLKLKLGEGMRIDVNGALESAQSLTASDPLAITNDTLGLKMNTSSFFVNGSGELDIKHQQTLTAEQPLVIEDEKLKLKTNATLITNNSGQLQISLHGSAPINVTNQNVISLDIDTKGLRIQDGKLKLAVKAPLYLTPDNLLGFEPLTMWTGSDTSNNAILDRGSSKNARLDLILTKQGNMINGMIRVTANLGSIATVDCMIYFDRNGVFQAERSNLKEFGFKINNSISTGYNSNLAMMPNSTYYPRHTDGYEQNWRVYDRHMVPVQLRQINSNQFYLMQINYNQMSSSDQGYTLFFKWKPTTNTFQTGWTCFSYLAEQ